MSCLSELYECPPKINFRFYTTSPRTLLFLYPFTAPRVPERRRGQEDPGKATRVSRVDL